MAKKPLKTAEREWIAKVKSLPCALCYALGERTPCAHAHHIREGQGLAQRAGHRLTIPLCYECHEGKNGIHGNQNLLRIAKVSELDLLEITLELLQARFMS